MSFENFSLILPKNNNDINGIFHQFNNIKAIPFASYEYPEKNYDKYAPIKSDSTYNWLSNNKNNSWYRLRFPNILFYITNSIQAGDKGCNSNVCCYRFPSRWRLDGKVNGIWRKLDFVENSGFTNKSTGEVLTQGKYTQNIMFLK